MQKVKASKLRDKLIVRNSTHELNYKKKKKNAIYNQYDRQKLIQSFKFVDDTFLLPKIEHLERLRDLIQPLNIMFGCSVMPNTIKEDKVKDIKKSLRNK